VELPRLGFNHTTPPVASQNRLSQRGVPSLAACIGDEPAGWAVPCYGEFIFAVFIFNKSRISKRRLSHYVPDNDQLASR